MGREKLRGEVLTGMDTGKCRLVMTLLVRDEADIIRQNIEFHLARGVDFIIATDNASVDGTRDILREYEKKGLLHLIVEEELSFSQAEWVNRMGRMAHEEYGADIVIHCDADEFWYPRSGNLKTEILSSDADALYAKIINVIMKHRGGAESFPMDTRYAVVKPMLATDIKKNWNKANRYLFRSPDKVFFKTSGGLLEVINGNHDIARSRRSVRTGVSEDIMIYHYPLRGKEHFFHKVVTGCSALASNRQHSMSTGLHWRLWYESYRKDRLDDEYERLTLKDDEAERLMSEGVIEEMDFEELCSGRAGLALPVFSGSDEPMRSGRVLSAENIRRSIRYISEFGFADFLRKAKEKLRQYAG